MQLERLTIEPAGGGGAACRSKSRLAASDQEKALGLMFRTKLADNEGMLFPYGARAGRHDVDAQHVHPARYGFYSRRRRDSPH